MDQPKRDRSRSRIGSIGLAIAFSALVTGGAFCVSGCGNDSGEGMIDNPKDATKSQDAQDSMKAYMKNMQTKGMKPGMKSAAQRLPASNGAVASRPGPRSVVGCCLSTVVASQV